MGGRGIFITFEGGEGAGKTTLIRSIAQAVTQRGRSVLQVREPGGTPLGEEIRQLVLHRRGTMSPYAELSLFLASRAQHIAEVIGPALEEGNVVLCDRFNDSTVVYQGVGRGLGVEKVAQFCEFISQGLRPHLTLYLDLDPELGLSRAAKAREQDRMESETLMFHRKIRDGYLAIHKKEQTRFRLVDATLPPERVFHEAMKLIVPYV